MCVWSVVVLSLSLDSLGGCCIAKVHRSAAKISSHVIPHHVLRRPPLPRNIATASAARNRQGRSFRLKLRFPTLQMCSSHRITNLTSTPQPVRGDPANLNHPLHPLDASTSRDQPLDQTPCCPVAFQKQSATKQSFPSSIKRVSATSLTSKLLSRQPNRPGILQSPRVVISSFSHFLNFFSHRKCDPTFLCTSQLITRSQARTVGPMSYWPFSSRARVHL